MKGIADRRGMVGSVATLGFGRLNFLSFAHRLVMALAAAGYMPRRRGRGCGVGNRWATPSRMAA